MGSRTRYWTSPSGRILQMQNPECKQRPGVSLVLEIASVRVFSEPLEVYWLLSCSGSCANYHYYYYLFTGNSEQSVSCANAPTNVCLCPCKCASSPRPSSHFFRPDFFCVHTGFCASRHIFATPAGTARVHARNGCCFTRRVRVRVHVAETLPLPKSPPSKCAFNSGTHSNPCVFMCVRTRSLGLTCHTHELNAAFGASVVILCNQSVGLA